VGERLGGKKKKKPEESRSGQRGYNLEGRALGTEGTAGLGAGIFHISGGIKRLGER